MKLTNLTFYDRFLLFIVFLAAYAATGEQIGVLIIVLSALIFFVGPAIIGSLISRD
jgi:hypothetical protein